MVRTKTGFTLRPSAGRRDEVREEISGIRGAGKETYRGRAPIDKNRRWGGSGIAAIIKDGREKVLTERMETQDQHELLRSLARKHAPDAAWHVTAPGSLLTRG